MSVVLSDIEERHARNLGKRTIIGIQLYVVVWSFIVISTGFYRTNPYFSYLMLALLLTISLLRSIHFYYYEKLIKKNPKLNYRLLLYGIFLSVLVWSGLHIFFILNSSNVQIKMLILITVAGFASGGCISYSPDRRISLIYITTLLLPSVGVICLMKQEEIPLALIMLIYYVYLFFLVRKTNKEYWVALKNEIELERQSLTDVLTSLYNRRYFNKILEVEV